MSGSRSNENPTPRIPLGARPFAGGKTDADSKSMSRLTLPEAARPFALPGQRTATPASTQGSVAAPREMPGPVALTDPAIPAPMPLPPPDAEFDARLGETAFPVWDADVADDADSSALGAGVNATDRGGRMLMAAMIEGVAERVRSGQIPVAHSSTLGDETALLAAVLASLLAAKA